MDPGLQEAVDLAVAYQLATTTITGRVSSILALIWSSVDPGAVAASWGGLLPEAVGAFTAAQSAAAGLADGFVGSTLAAQGVDVAAALARTAVGVADPGPAGILGAPPTPPVGGLALDPEAFAGSGASGIPLETLLGIPGARADAAIAAGMAPTQALTSGGHALRMYAATEVNDASTLATQVAGVTHGASRYIRVVGARCCSRCAILSGRVYKVSAFQRHPACGCRMLVIKDADTSGIETPLDLYRQGRITDLTAAEKQALDAGADISQVVNAKQGMYQAGGRSYTTTGTTRRGIAGARNLQARIDQAAGTPRDRYWNYTVSRAAAARAAAKYGPLMQRGLPFERRNPTGGVDVVKAQFRSSGRRTVAQIMADHPDHEGRLTSLINEGYVVRPTDVAKSNATLRRLFEAS